METRRYRSRVGEMTLAADGLGLVGAWFAGQRHFGELGSPRRIPDVREMCPEGPPARILDAACIWLDTYFAGEEPARAVPLHLIGTPFQLRVWGLLRKIPRGSTTTYGALASQLERDLGRRMSARAVGGAVGRNPVSVIVPCHRVLGATGKLTGYAGGVERKRELLALEGALRA